VADNAPNSRPLLGSQGIPVPAGGRNFQGRPARGQPRRFAAEAADTLERRFSTVSRYDRRARVFGIEWLTTTGTFRLTLQVTDGRPFTVLPGNFVGIEGEVEGEGFLRSPYCIASAPTRDLRFDLIVRVVPQGPLSQVLARLRPGDDVAFRGPKGRTMLPKDPTRDIVIVATGVAVAPCTFFASQLLSQGFGRRVELFWGARLRHDIWSTADLDRLAAAHPNFSYGISLSQPRDDWDGLRGRVTESVPPLLDHLADKSFYLMGNGIMIAELASALSDLGVARHYVYEEPYFDVHHRPDPAVVDAIRDRFAAGDLFSARAHREAALYDPVRSVAARAPNVDASSPSDAARGPDFLSHKR
jgi:ferredoxin-NADP reductase